MTTRSRELGWMALAALLLPLGCQATATGNLKASASVNEGVEADAEGEAKVEVKAKAKVDAPSIKYDAKAGTLDYSGTIDFEYNEDHLEGEVTFHVLGDLAKYLKKQREVTLEVEGHTDSRGTPDYNRNLSKRRADAIRDWLVKHGIAAERVTATGHGEDDATKHEPKECLNQLPKDPAVCEEAWGKSRRAVFKVTGGGETIVEEPEEESPPTPKKRLPAQGMPEAPRRVWFVAAHIGYFMPVGDVTTDAALRRYVKGAIPIGVGAGYWLSPRTAIGAMGELGIILPPGYCDNVTAAEQPCKLSAWRWRLEGFFEFHTSTGPNPSGWLGLALGLTGFSVDVTKGALHASQMRVGPYLAVRGGVDFFATPQFRIGPYVEAMAGRFGATGGEFAPDPALAEAGDTHGYLGLGLRGAYDFFGK